MFYGATVFNQYIGSWDVSSVTSMKSLFRDTEAFDQNLNGWDVSRVEDMSSMFSKAEAFNKDLSGWDVSNVEDLRGMFKGAAFNQPIGAWDVSSVTRMADLFRDASSFDQDLNAWDVSSVVDMDRMFEDVSLSFDLCWDVTKVPSSQVVAPIYDQDMPPCSVPVGLCVGSVAGGEFKSIAGEAGVVEIYFPSDYRDGVPTEVDLPFPFPFFGTTYTTVWVGPNGNLLFTDGITVGETFGWYGRPDDVVEPLDGTQQRIAVAVNDWSLEDYGIPNVTAPALLALDTGDSLIISFEHVMRWRAVEVVNFQIELYPDGSADVRFGPGTSPLPTPFYVGISHEPTNYTFNVFADGSSTIWPEQQGLRFLYDATTETYSCRSLDATAGPTPETPVPSPVPTPGPTMPMMTLTGPPGSGFGSAVGLSEEWVVVGADDEGAVYVYNRGTLEFVAKLTGASDGFGRLVDVDGSIIVVGSNDFTYVYRYNNTSWEENAKLRWSSKFAISGSVLVLADSRASTNYEYDQILAGAAYAYYLDDDGTWTEVATFPLDTDPTICCDIYFAWSIAVDGDTIVIGAKAEETDWYMGGAMIYKTDDGGLSWRSADPILSTQLAAHTNFGTTVAISGNTIIVGADGFQDPMSIEGAVGVFDSGTPVARLTGSHEIDFRHGFGSIAAIDGTFIVVSSRQATYVFQDWKEIAHFNTTSAIAVDNGLVALGYSDLVHLYEAPSSCFWALQFGPGPHQYKIIIDGITTGPGQYRLEARAKVDGDYDGTDQRFLRSLWYNAGGDIVGRTNNIFDADAWPTKTNEWQPIFEIMNTQYYPVRVEWFVGYPGENTQGYKYITDLKVIAPDGTQYIPDGDFQGGNHLSAFQPDLSYGDFSIIPDCSTTDLS